ncbi:MAG: peptidoglycan-binding protein [Eubacteriales bacterium]|nr:peptidoglycan-binding protein [Eubacteriales bacterium]
MIKFRSAVLYVLVIAMAIMLFASFDAEFFFDYSKFFDISPEMMFRAFTDNTDNLATESDDPTTPPLVTEYKLGDSNTTVLNYKKKLYYLKFLSEYPEDKIFDTKTVQAVTAYQTSRGLEVTGTINPQTRNSLDGEAITYAAGVRGEKITETKDLLKTLGYYPQDAVYDDVFDEEMVDALKKYQENNSLEITGELDVFTLFAMMGDVTDQYDVNGDLYRP